MGSTFDFRKRAEIEDLPIPWGKHRAYEFASALVAPHELLYVCRSGSHLHGTATENSDTDFKGVFLPSKESCYLNDVPSQLTYSTGDVSLKNTSEDVDFELWSVHKWFKLLEKGDSNALSMLFSSANEDMVIYCNPKINEILMNPFVLYNPVNVDSFVGFSKSQAVKYGIKSTRLQIIENVLHYIQSDEYDRNDKLSNINLSELIELCYTDVNSDKDYLGLVEKGDRTFLRVLTKLYQTTITLDEFMTRMQHEYDKYGHRTHVAKELDGYEWKALSHSLRTLFEAKEMLEMGHIMYPLLSAGVLLSVKNGDPTFDEFETVYLQMEKAVENLKKTTTQQNLMDTVAKQKMLLNLYGKDDTNAKD